METEILEQLTLIRVYIFIIMLAVVLWALFKIIESGQRVFIGFKKAWDASFDNKMEALMDTGDYDEVISRCEGVLDDQPNHLNATWYAAKAHYYLENNDASQEYFEKTIYLAPSWEETVNEYLVKLKNC